MDEHPWLINFPTKPSILFHFEGSLLLCIIDGPKVTGTVVGTGQAPLDEPEAEVGGHSVVVTGGW